MDKKIAGLYEVRQTKKDGTVVLSYRVKITRKNFKIDKVFPENELQQAIELINASKSVTGKNKIKLLEEESKLYEQVINDYMSDPPLSLYIDRYIEKYINIKYKGIDLETDEGKFKFRNYKSTKSFFNQIKATEIKQIGGKDWTLSKLIYQHIEGKKKFGDFKPSEITEYEINEFISALLKKGLKPISVQRYLTHISNVFKKIRFLNPDLKSLRNPVLDYDRDLLKEHGNLVTKKPFRFSDEDRKKLFEELEKYPNPEMKWIIELMLFTALRRSEVVLLKWSQISENSIYLTHTKSGKPRTVYLIPQAKELLNSIPKRPNDDRLFTYSVLGFDGSLVKFMERIGIKTKSHGFRKESISNFIEEIGAGNSLLIATFLGFANTKKLEETIEKEQALNPSLQTQKDVLKSVGHQNSSVTHSHYFSLKK
ncbi:MAG TPA: integrase [Paraburkholderia sp.]|uniref:tyrosine-type recombinase/integrase n=1 Tax=Paraburkholderia sp. TaxID=1926495 RepID=UPI002ED1B579